MGGIPLANGKKVKSRFIYRTGGLQNATENDLMRLKYDYAVENIFDFRGEADAKMGADRVPEDVEYINFPVLPPHFGKREKTTEPPDFIAIFHEVYGLIAESDTATKAYSEFFKVLLKGRGVLFHCHQGKDRTGIGAYLLLTALGADHETARADYLLTNEYMEKYIQTKIPEKDAFDEKTLRDLYLVRDEYLERYIARTEELYGSVYESLKKRFGLTEEDILRLRELYTE